MDVEGERRRDKYLNFSKSGIIFLLVKDLLNNPGKCNIFPCRFSLTQQILAEDGT